MGKKYSITEDQLHEIEHYKDMFEYHAELIRNLCNDEKSDIVYGFELGKIYNQLSKFHLEMIFFIDNIKKSS